MVFNENMTFLGHVSGEHGSAQFTVEQRLPGINFSLGPGGMLTFMKQMLGFRKRLPVEAARRGQPVPVVRLPQ